MHIDKYVFLLRHSTEKKIFHNFGDDVTFLLVDFSNGSILVTINKWINKLVDDWHYGQTNLIFHQQKIQIEK